jgi:hypothetical protein
MNVDYLAVIIRWLHLAAVIIAIGGAVYVRFVLLPAGAAVLDGPALDRLREALQHRWRRVVHSCIAILLASGLFNLHSAARDGRPTAYWLLFAVKFFAALGVFFLASALVGRSPAFATLRNQPRRWLGLIVLLAAVIVLLSGLMRTFTGRS